MTLWRLAGIGLELAMTVGVFAALGWWLDNKFGWTPWGLFGFAMLGVVAGLYRFIRTTMK
jgi:F0F1-type ATP synthase assembly protein I